MSADRPALQAHVLEWLHGSSGVCAVHVTPREQRKIHINFTSMSALGAALSRFPFLVRCGSIGSASQWNSKPCGPPRHKLPEVLQLSCTPSSMKAMSELNSDVVALLSKMALEYIGLWYSASSRDVASRSGRGPINRLSFYVLPRQIDGLDSIIQRLHLKFELWGGKVRVHAPNTPALLRCNQCDQLGHHANECIMYNGLAIRLLMKDPISFHAVSLLASASGARIGFLGSSVDEMKPCRRVTLLFDVQASQSDDEVSMEQILTRLAPVVSMHKSLLFSEPTVVHTKDRHRECRECGRLAQMHECPFAPGMKPTSGRPNMNGTSASASAVGPLAAGRPPSRVPQADDHMFFFFF
jgi:hypothetical protein